MTDAKTIIADNHAHAPHAVSVTVADVAAAADKTYSIMGMANHDHMITITAAQFGTLKMGGTIMVTSTVTLCHMHVVTVSCG